MKKFGFISGIVVLTAILVGAGFYLGSSMGIMRDAFSNSILDRTLAEASIRAAVLHGLDSGQIEEARSLLQTQLNSDIFTIWLVGEYSDPRSRKLATNVLAKISAYRAEYPANYTNRMQGSGAEFDRKIAEILRKAKQQSTK